MNKVILLGRLTKDPELRYTTTNNTAVCTFTLAVNRRFVRAGEERQADFIPIVVWDKLAEFCGKYFLKGRQVAIVGRIQTRTWDDNEGKRHYVTEVVAEEAYFADSKPEEVSRRSDNFNLGFDDHVMPSENDGDDGFYQDDDDDELPF